MNIKTTKKLCAATATLLLLSAMTIPAFATGEEGTTSQSIIDIEINPVEPETEDVVTPEPVETEPVTKKPKTTEPRETEKKQEKPAQTEEHNNGGGQTNQKTVVNNNVTKSVTTTEEATTLPKGAFYVYMEPNNGEKRLKHLCEKEDVIPRPDDPERKGFIFDGWYADADFKTAWDFQVSVAKKGTVIYAKWKADTSTVLYDVTVASVTGGTIEVSPEKACEGETVNIIVTPDSGMRLKEDSVTVNGEKTQLLSFTMPAKDVTISAAFETAPTKQNEGGNNLLLFVIIGVVVLGIVAFVVLNVLRNRRAISEDDTDDETWVDETIVVEDAFSDGVKRKENNSISLTDEEPEE